MDTKWTTDAPHACDNARAGEGTCNAYPFCHCHAGYVREGASAEDLSACNICRAPNKGAPHKGDARTARATHAILGNVGTIGEGRLAVGYAWCERERVYHIAPRDARMGALRHGYTNHLPWDMNGRRYATRAENTTYVGRIGTQRGTYTTLDRVDANARSRTVFLAR